MKLSLEFARAFAFSPSDSDHVRAEKAAILIVSTICCFFGLVWGAVYFSLFGVGLTTALPFGFSVIVGLALLASHITTDHRIAIHAQIICIIYITTFVQWSIGGVFDSGIVMAWALMGPLLALMFFPVRQAMMWQGLLVLNVLLTVIFDDLFVANGQNVGETTRHAFYVMNLGIASTVVFAFTAFCVADGINEKQKADRLLLNILPEKIARSLKSHTGVIADNYDSASVLFADIVNYTAYSSDKKPTHVVSILNDVFTRFDKLAEQHGLEKIKTIGDAYMVAGGLPEISDRHQLAIAAIALDMMDAVGSVITDGGKPFELRIGIHTGPVIAGVIGRRKFAYDLWGDTVNLASRLEASAKPG